MPIVDTHCHLDEEAFATDLSEVLRAAAEHGVSDIVTIGTDAASSRRSVELARINPHVHAAVGIHPNYCAAAGAGDWDIIEELALDPAVVAVGETGLDRYWNYAPPELQREYFARHLDLSRRIGKPFIVHCRDADQEVVEMLREAAASGPLNGVMHSFCQSKEIADACLSFGMLLSFTGMLTFKRNEELRLLAASLPRDRVMVETDAPYLAPTPHRGKRNEPAFVRYTLKCLAELHGLEAEEMARITTENAVRLFQLDRRRA